MNSLAVPERPSSVSSGCCCHHQGRNLVVCIDGTSNQFGETNTNVIELFELVAKDDQQRGWYNPGIGAHANPELLLHRLTDLAFAWSFKETVIAAYQWLSDNYNEGDSIFLFGFSRGAYQVRVLSAMIHKVGLLHKGNEKQISFAFEVYANYDTDKISETDRSPISAAEGFKRKFSRDVRVHFVGAWDTVSSIGVMRSRQLHPGTVDGMEHVCYFRHALALDERRVKFLPEYAYGGRTEQEQSDTTEVQDGILLPTLPRILEVWFAGTHSDIGGRNALSAERRCEPPLRWMVLEAMTFGLRLAQVHPEFLHDWPIEVNESLTRPWLILEYLPVKRLTLTREDSSEVTRMPHHGSCRKIHDGQRIHYSVLSEVKKGYVPKASLPGSVDWNDLHAGPNRAKWVQHDLHSEIRSIFDGPADRRNNLRETFDRIAGLLHGPRAVCEIIISALNTEIHGIERNHHVLKSLMEFLHETSEDKSQISRRMPKFLSQLLDNKKYKKTAVDFMAKYTNYCINEFHGHKKTVRSTAFSADGTLVVSGSDDSTILVWNVETGEPEKLFTGHSDCVNAVAFSPCDNGRVVSGSSDKTIRMWDVEIGKQSGKSFAGHSRCVISVAFSGTGDRIVSGSADNTVRIWDVETRKQLFKMNHTGWVRFVAFYDNERVVSASDDKTIQVWDSKTGRPSMRRMIGHTDWVRFVAFLPNSDRLVSASDDKTIRIWDMKTGEQSGEPFKGHSHCVRCVAFSCDGNRVTLVSGSNDKTIRTWDVDTRAQLKESFQGQSHSVTSATSVTFSSDGERVVLGWSDGTIRICLVPNPV